MNENNVTNAYKNRSVFTEKANKAIADISNVDIEEIFKKYKNDFTFEEIVFMINYSANNIYLDYVLGLEKENN